MQRALYLPARLRQTWRKRRDRRSLQNRGDTMDEFNNNFLINALVGLGLALLFSFAWVWFS
jgi:hypothetical protein